MEKLKAIGRRHREKRNAAAISTGGVAAGSSETRPDDFQAMAVWEVDSETVETHGTTTSTRRGSVSMVVKAGGTTLRSQPSALAARSCFAHELKFNPKVAYPKMRRRDARR